ncbi:hypothetical protein C5S29_09295, partial [ANME-1 cluster archaeon GoMg3.2]|nr:hypothetical protein [ANME-1 cluster archaeon GoMg3.2]
MVVIVCVLVTAFYTPTVEAQEAKTLKIFHAGS